MITRGVFNEGDTSRDFTCSVHHVSRWLWALAFGLLVAGFGYGSSVAFAATEEVLLSDQMAFEAGSDEVRSGWMMLAYNDFNAAVLVIGQNPQDYRLDLDVRAKLSNESTGGAFYELSQEIHDTGASGNDLPSWAAGLYGDFGTIWGSSATSNGMGIYWCEVSPELIAAAKADYLTILHGGDVGGGGGSGGDVDGYIGFSCPVVFTSSQYSYWRFSKNGVTYTNSLIDAANGNYTLLPDTVNVYIPYESISGVSGYESLLQKPYRYLVMHTNATHTNTLPLSYIVFADVPGTMESRTFSADYSGVSKSGTYTIAISYSANVDTIGRGPGSNNIPLNSFDFDGTSFWVSDTYIFGPKGAGTSYTGVPISGDSTTGGTPENNWPDNPEVVTPTPPSLPTPSNPAAPTYITKPTYVSNTYTADLQGILDALDEHCQHLQDSIFDNLSGYYDAMSGFLGQEFAELRDYLHDLFHWLASQMDFTFTAPGYNDSSVVSWLKRIYSKLGRGGVTTRPSDPVTDPDGVGNWFEQLLKNFLGALFGIGSEAVNGLLDALGELKEKFPFSIPWDIAAMLMLLGAHPVAPAFDIPLYTLTASGLQQVGQYEIDLDVFSPYMAGIRDMETIVFAACLAFKTDFFKGMLEIKKG